MLTSMRKHRKFLNIFLWLVIFAFLATIVVVWGLGENTNTENYVVRIDDRSIGYDEFQFRESNVDPETRSLMGDNFRKWFLNEVINSELLLLEANRLDIPVSNVETANAITQNAAFMTNGQFDITQYQTILEYNGLTPATFEDSVREEIKLSKMIQLIRDSVSVTDAEIQQEFLYQNTKLAVSYFAVPAANYLNTATPADAALSEYFTQNQERYRIAPQVKLKYFIFNDDSFEYKPEIAETAIRDRYTASVATFTEPEALDLSEIYIKVPAGADNATNQQALDKISAAFADVKANKPFADVARQYSTDEFATNGGYIGRIARPAGELPAELATVFALKSGETSEIVKTSEGYAIFKVDNHTEARVTPYEEAKGGILMAMEDEARAGAYRNYVYGIYREITTAGNITAYITKNPDKFKVIETEFISEDGANSIFLTDAEVKATIFTLGQTEISPIMEIGDDSYIFEVADRVNSRIPELNNVRAQVIEDYKNTKAFEAAVNDVNAKVTTESASAQEFATMATGFNSKVETIPAFTRLGLPDVAWAEDLAEMLFKDDVNSVVTYPMPLGQTIYVVHVDSIAKPDNKELDGTKAQIAMYLKDVKAEGALTGVIDALKRKHKVLINPNFQ